MKLKRKLFAAAALALCLGSLAGCASQNEEESSLDPMMESNLMAGSQAVLQELAGYSDADIETMIQQYEYNDNTDMVNSLENWMSNKEEVGSLIEVNNVAVSYEDGEYTAEIDAQFERCPVVVTIISNRQGALTSMEFTPQYSLADNMSRAAVHTIIGMGTVFIVLIFISFLISRFKYINAWEKRHNAGKAEEQKPVSAAAPAAASAAAEEIDPALVAGMMAAVAAEENLVNDLELVSVITAAIAAYTDTPADGLVVRSIKRKPGSRWK
ncbi:MAG TPA: OadG family protein [Candidatus Cottocaccamicrobium excrementipullorum]|nr:OadG family protein [Candidatus Cottocaccamicrobium excrementipullorum]